MLNWIELLLTFQYFSQILKISNTHVPTFLKKQHLQKNAFLLIYLFIKTQLNPLQNMLTNISLPIINILFIYENTI